MGILSLGVCCNTGFLGMKPLALTFFLLLHLLFLVNSARGQARGLGLVRKELSLSYISARTETFGRS